MFSAVCFAATAAVLVLIGAELGSLPQGALAAAVLLSSPVASRYAQEARPFALATLAATTATWAVLVAARRDTRPAWLGYGAAVVLCGLTNVISLLILPAHAVWVLERRTSTRRWLITLAASLIALSWFIIAAAAQRDQVGGVAAARLSQLPALINLDWPSRALVLLLLAGAFLTAVSTRPARRPLLLAATWGWLPAILLWTVSLVHPMLAGRYLVFCLPGAALAIATPIRTRLPAPARTLQPAAVTAIAAAAAAALAATSWPTQLSVRGPTGHLENMRRAAGTLTDHSPAGGAVVFIPAYIRLVTLTYPPPGDHAPHDLLLDTAGPDSATLTGTERDPASSRHLMTGQTELWLLAHGGHPNPTTTTDHAKYDTLTTCFTLTATWRVRAYLIQHYTRRQPQPPNCT